MRALWYVIILSSFLTGCRSHICNNEFPTEHPSPDGKWKYVIFDRNCGATTTNNLQVSVLPASASLPNESGNAFIADSDHGATSRVAEVVWVGSYTLQINYSSKARVFRKEAQIGPVQINYGMEQ